MFGTNASTNETQNVYNLMVQEISRGWGYWARKAGYTSAHFVDMGALVKTKVEKGIDKLFDIQGHKMDVSDQSI